MAVTRRQFLQLATGTALTVPLVSHLPAVPLPARPGRGPGKSLIMLWMDGGLPHMDLWSTGRHVGHANQGPFQPIKTAAKDIEISAALPKIAEQFASLSVIRTLKSDEVEATRATTLMLTGTPAGRDGVKAPHIGALASYLAGDSRAPLRFVSVGSTAARIGQGFLPALLAPAVVANAGMIPENFRTPTLGDPATTADRAERRQDLVNTLDDLFDSAANDRARQLRLEERRALAAAAQEVTRDASRVFEFTAEDQKSLESYGNTAFGRGCLLARKLVEYGVGAVQVNLPGWNSHTERGDVVRKLGTGVLDPAFATLMKELTERGRLADTLVVCLAPYGILPRINDGPTPWGHGWDVVLGGAGIKPGVEYGTMDVGGMRIQEKPVTVAQLHATIYAALGIDAAKPRHELTDNLGKPFTLPGTNAETAPIRELLIDRR